MIPMHGIEQLGMAGRLLAWVAQAVVFGTLLTLVTAGVLLVLRKRLSPALLCAAWCVVLLKFVLPVGPGWSWSLASMAKRVAAPIHANAPVAADEPSMPQFILLGNGEAATAAATVTEAPPRDWLGLGVTLGAAAYLLCLMWIAARRLWNYAAFVGACKRLPLADAEFAAVVADVCRRVGLKRMPTVRISDEAPAPYIYGIRQPTLVLSRRQLVRPDELEAVVLHEIAHLRRGDLFVRYVQWIAGTWLFFWPVVAWVNRRIDLAREAACDEWALRHGRLSAGEYSRCLLRALQPGAMRGMRYLPAAMAANLETVERRIEMIMDSKRTRWMRGSRCVPAIALLAAWAAFALSGAKAADEAKPQTAGQKEEGKSDGKEGQTKTIVVTKVADSDSDADVDKAIEEALKDLEPAMREKIKAQMAREGGKGMAHRVMLHRTHAGKGGAPRIAMLGVSLDEPDMAEFAKSHPTADADGDGKVTRQEHDAFVIAVAMTDTAAVLAKYPGADRNKDGQLDANEIARWTLLGGQQECATFVAAGEAPAAGQAVKQQRMEVNVVRRAKINVNGGKFEMPMPMPPASAHGKWIVENIKAEPAAAEVARFVSLVEETPRVAFLETHPEADADKDGKLTDDERDQFMHGQMSKWMLEAHPELDVNKDGVLSHEEMAALHGKGGMMKVLKVKTRIGGPDGETKDTEKTIVLEGSDEDEGDVVIELEEEEAEQEFQP